MKQYKAIFFDWDGTAVVSRKAPVEEAVEKMKTLLAKGIKLVIVSGTTYENIAGGKLQDYFTEEELRNLYLGLGRGAYNYKFEGKTPVVFKNRIPEKRELLKIHDICYEIHKKLLDEYDFATDIVFTRPNYCKIDIMVENIRGENLFMQENELDILRETLKKHGIKNGLQELLDIAKEIGRKNGIFVRPTCDAKYLEVGVSDKSDNVDIILEELEQNYGITAKECSFWGDEFVGLEAGIFGSDSYMQTDKTKGGDFFDVSNVSGSRPEGVKVLGGGIQCFLDFLGNQAE